MTAKKTKPAAKRAKRLGLNKHTLKDLGVRNSGPKGGAGAVSRKVQTVQYGCG